MRSLCYVSSACEPFSPAQLDQLLARSRAANERTGVTGLLLHNEGNFMQVIEGPAAAVSGAYARIGRSRLHRGIIQLFDEPIAGREFPAWAMACRSLPQPAMLEMLNARQSVRHQLVLQFWQGCR
jgi:hypothetical protein